MAASPAPSPTASPAKMTANLCPKTSWWQARHRTSATSRHRWPIAASRPVTYLAITPLRPPFLSYPPRRAVGICIEGRRSVKEGGETLANNAPPKSISQTPAELYHRRPKKHITCLGPSELQKTLSPLPKVNPKLASTPTQGLSKLPVLPTPSNFGRANQAEQFRQPALAINSSTSSGKILVMGNFPSDRAISRNRRPTILTFEEATKFAKTVLNNSTFATVQSVDIPPGNWAKILRFTEPAHIPRGVYSQVPKHIGQRSKEKSSNISHKNGLLGRLVRGLAGRLRWRSFRLRNLLI